MVLAASRLNVYDLSSALNQKAILAALADPRYDMR